MHGEHPPACELDVVLLACGTLIAVHPADLARIDGSDEPFGIEELEGTRYEELNDLVRLKPRVDREIAVPRIQPLEVAFENAMRNDWRVLLEIKGSSKTFAKRVGHALASLLRKAFDDSVQRPMRTTVASFCPEALQELESSAGPSAWRDRIAYAMFWPSTFEQARRSALSRTAVANAAEYGYGHASWTANGLAVAREFGLVPIVHASAVEEAESWMQGKRFGCYKVPEAEAERTLRAGASFVISEPSSYR